MPSWRHPYQMHQLAIYRFSTSSNHHAMFYRQRSYHTLRHFCLYCIPDSTYWCIQCTRGTMIMRHTNLLCHCHCHTVSSFWQEFNYSCTKSQYLVVLKYGHKKFYQVSKVKINENYMCDCKVKYHEKQIVLAWNRTLTVLLAEMKFI